MIFMVKNVLRRVCVAELCYCVTMILDAIVPTSMVPDVLRVVWEARGTFGSESRGDDKNV